MLVTPDVREQKPADVRQSRDLRTLMFDVVGPDIRSKVRHHVDMVVGLTSHVPCDWQVKVYRDPPFHCVPQHVLVESRQKFALLVNWGRSRTKPRDCRLTS